jgi:hypothetical protein
MPRGGEAIQYAAAFADDDIGGYSAAGECAIVVGPL